MGAPVGNQNAKKARVWSEAIKRALARYSGDSVDAGLDRLADRLVRAAMEHEDEQAAAQIMERIGDRLEGKPAQSLTVGGDAENPLVIQEVALTAVDP